jgi:uncharacterized protein YjeT (DUF2065 family)
MRHIFGGAILLIAGIAAFIEAHSHPPLEGLRERGGPSHLSRTAYDLLRIGAWALVILGGLLVIVGLIRYWAVQRHAADTQRS